MYLKSFDTMQSESFKLVFENGNNMKHPLIAKVDAELT